MVIVTVLALGLAHAEDKIMKITVDSVTQAVDKNGNTHTGGWWGRSTGLKTLATTKFFNVKPEQIQKYQLQFRPYQWVEFKNVSLRPGHKTDVEF